MGLGCLTCDNPWAAIVDHDYRTGLDPAAAAAAARENIWSAVASDERSTLVDSPPGAGKSTLVREISRRARLLAQVAIIVQTNDQADDMVRARRSTESSARCTPGPVTGPEVRERPRHGVPGDAHPDNPKTDQTRRNYGPPEWPGISRDRMRPICAPPVMSAPRRRP